MSKSVIKIKNLSKSYMIGHEGKAAPGTLTLRDSLTGAIKKPIELLTGHKLKKEKFWALKDINIEINQGDVVGIIGRNGSGKSTMLKILSRIVEPTSGEIIMRGKVASLLEVGTGFHPELTGRENIYFNGSILGMKKKEIDAKFDEIVAFSEVEKFLDTPVKFYSSGMYVRLAFSVAAYLEPDILIVDEVLAVGDAAFQKKCLGKMKDVACEGRTVLFVSHNMASIKSLCTKALWLDHGRLVDIGDLEKVTEEYTLSSITDESNLENRVRTAKLSGEAKIVDLNVHNDNSSHKTIDPSKPMTMTFKIKSKSKLVDPVNIHARITSSGSSVISFSTELTGKLIKLDKGINVVSCNIDKTNLLGGSYSIDCSLTLDNTKTSLHVDEIFDAKSFSVKDMKTRDGDVLITQREAVYWVEHEWKQK